MSETRTLKEELKAMEARMQCILHLLSQADRWLGEPMLPGNVRRYKAYLHRAKLVAGGMSEDEMWQNTAQEVTL